MSDEQAKMLEMVLADNRYAPEAYDFLRHALLYTQKMLGKDKLPPTDDPQSIDHHVTGQQLVEGIRQFALAQFGMMAAVVLRMWGVRSTRDFGEMVYRLIEYGGWHKSPEDSIEDFDNLYDFDQAFVRNYRIEWDED